MELSSVFLKKCEDELFSCVLYGSSRQVPKRGGSVAVLNQKAHDTKLSLTF